MYSLDFRRRVFTIREKENLTFAQTSKRFGVGMRTLFAWQKRIEPKTTRNKPATKIDMEALRKDVRQHPDRFQWERAQDYSVSAWAIGKALRRLNFSFKKNSLAS
jgi:transposase